MKKYKVRIKRTTMGNVLNMDIMFKKCKKCNKILFRSNFRKSGKSPTGLDYNCKECENSRYTHVCELCGKQFSNSHKEQMFCSYKCRGQWKSMNEKIKYNCDYCGKEIEVKKSHYNYHENHFCSRECKNRWQISKTKVNCDYCGKEISIVKSKLRYNKNFFCSCECNNKWRSENVRGENHPCYNPNLTQEDREKERNISGYKNFIMSVYERDNYICQCCGQSKSGRLNAHHIYGYSEYKNLRTDVDNGITLCEDCHKEYHKQYGYKNNNYKDFRTFLYNEMIKQNTLEARLFYANVLEDITLRFEIKHINIWEEDTSKLYQKKDGE